MTHVLGPRPVPLRALVISGASLAVPVAGALLVPDWQEEQGVLVWMTALVPAFLLAYYRGLPGVAVALAGGMAALAVTQVVVVGFGLATPNWALLLGVVAVYVGICVALAVFSEILHRERRAAQEMALVDVLTGLANRRHGQVFLERQFAAAARGRPLVVALFDLDRFKRINDVHGHDAGDEALRAFGRVLARHTRRMDLSARYGGEEFLAILTGGDVNDALVFADRVRQEIRGVGFPWGHVTVSVGVAGYQEGMGSHEVMVAAADRALYAAKEAGRDRITVAETYRADKIVTRPGERRLGVQAAPERGRETVLVVEDDLALMDALVRMLRAAGYRAEGTDDPEAVVRRYRDGPPDLLLTDVMMPRMNGLVLVDRVVRVRPDARVIYISGYLHKEVNWAGLPGAVVGFLEKPIELEGLLATVREVLDRGTGDVRRET